MLRQKKYSQVILRSYFDKRRVFDAATNISSTGGVYYSCSKSEQYFNEVLDVGKLDRLKGWVGPVGLDFFKCRNNFKFWTELCLNSALTTIRE